MLPGVGTGPSAGHAHTEASFILAVAFFILAVALPGTPATRGPLSFGFAAV